jgi:hypothetical protein
MNRPQVVCEEVALVVRTVPIIRLRSMAGIAKAIHVAKVSPVG